MVETARKLRNLLLLCGIISPLLYNGTDILASALYPGYSFINQYTSELFAIGAPTSNLVIPLFTVASSLSIAFAAGLWMEAGRNRFIRLIALMVIINAANGLILWNLFPMHMRGVETTFTDTMHNILAITGVIFVFLALGFGAAAFRNWFRPYSIATIVMICVPSILAFVYGPQVGSSQPTPLAGFAERTANYVWSIWVGVLIVLLFRAEGMSALSNRARAC